MNHFAARVVFAIIVLSLSKADVYLHNPGGSNNRLNERSAARANANRLFDSQVCFAIHCPEIHTVCTGLLIALIIK